MIHRHRIARAAAAGLLGLLIASCGGGQVVDVDKAKSAVTTSLTKWKEKGTPDQLTGIEIADPDWSAGLQLVDFQVKETSTPAQQGPRVVVVLNLKNRAGKKIDREVAYEVLIKDKIQAHAKLFSKDNKELLGELLKGLA